MEPDPLAMLQFFGPSNSSKKSQADDQLNLASLLSILDGTLELQGPIIVMTTNHPEKLDPALIRSGRISYQIYFGDLNVECVKDMLNFYYEKEIVDSLLEEYIPHYDIILDKKLPPNDLEAICKSNENFKECCSAILKYLNDPSILSVDLVSVDPDGKIVTEKTDEKIVWRTTWA